jgi:hypothetical protein
MASSAPALNVAPGEPAVDAVVLIVEGPGDQQIVRWLLEAAGYPLDRLSVLVAQGKFRAAKMAVDFAQEAPGRCAVLVDLDESNVPDAKARAQEQLGNPPAEVFCAVPCAEAWLFADDHAVRENADADEEVQRVVQRLPLPEEIPDPKQLAHFVFGPLPTWQFLRQIDIGRAAARSPSLRSFLAGMGTLLGISAAPLFEAVARDFSRDVIAGLIGEVSSGETVLWRTADGAALTADELRHHIEEGDEIGRQYSSDLLRISRDFLRRTANRNRP